MQSKIQGITAEYGRSSNDIRDNPSREDRKLGNRTTRTIDAEHLFATVGPIFHQVESDQDWGRNRWRLILIVVNSHDCYEEEVATT